MAEPIPNGGDAFHNQVLSLCAGTLDAPSAGELNQRLIESLELRREYLRIMRQVSDCQLAAMPERLRTEAPTRGVTRAEKEEVRDQEFSNRVEGPNSVFPPPISHSPVLGFLGAVGRQMQKSDVRIVGSLITLVVVAAFWGLYSKMSLPRAQEVNNAHKVAVARISNSAAAKWSQNAETKSADDAINSGELLQIDSGLVELQLKQGATLLIEGPASWSIDGNNSATLKRGKLVAKVPEQAIGFTLETPTAKIVDLGTEFATDVDGQQRTKLAVMKGSVTLLSAADNGGFSAQGRVVNAGRAAIVSPGESGEVTIEPASFSAEWVTHARQLSVASKQRWRKPTQASRYHRRVRETPGLVGYWRLGEDGRRRAVDEVGQTKSQPDGRSPGIYHDFPLAGYRQPGAIAGDASPAVRFNGTGSHIVCGNDAALNGSWEGVTIAAWINPASVEDRGVGDKGFEFIAGKWVNSVVLDHFALLRRGDKLLFAVADGVTAEVGLLGSGNVPLVAGRYQWVVGTWEAQTKQYRLYVNAQEDEARALQAGEGINLRSPAPFTIGGQIAREDQQPDKRYFAGKIDEVCVFRRALSPAEIQSLFEANSEVANE